jgi:hypothetical protein
MVTVAAEEDAADSVELEPSDAESLAGGQPARMRELAAKSASPALVVLDIISLFRLVVRS